MPKATRKKKIKSEDSKKAKLKVGKKKPAAENHTETSFKSHAIVVPSQSISENKNNGEAVNSKNQGLKDLLVHLRHYSAQVRKDAVIGLRDLFGRHPDALSAQLSAFFESVCKLTIDDDGGVRKVALLLLEDVCPTLSEDHVRPFMSLAIAYTCSAMTHISEDVRLDGLRFLNLWQVRYPDLVIAYADKIIPNYLGMMTSHRESKGPLSSGTGAALVVNPTSRMGSAKSRGEVLESLHTYLVRLLGIGDDKWWFFRGYGTLRPSGDKCDEESSLSWKDSGDSGRLLIGRFSLDADTSSATLSSVFRSAETAAPTQSKDQGRLRMEIPNGAAVMPENGVRASDFTNVKNLTSLVDTLMPVLIDLWLEGSANVFTAGRITMSPNLSLLHIVLKSMSLLWRILLVENRLTEMENGWVRSWLKTINKHLLVHFPFGSGNFAMKDKQVDIVLQDMNILFCELLSQFLLAGEDDTSSTVSWRDLMLEYIENIFKGSSRNGASAGDSQHVKISDLNAGQIQAIYPVVWAFLNSFDAERSSQLFGAFVDSMSTIANPAISKSACAFIAEILKCQDQSRYRGTFSATRNETNRRSACRWLLSLPKKLWQLKTTDLEYTEDIISILSYALRVNACAIHNDLKFLSGLDASLSPFFHTLTSKGSFFGPFITLGSTTQRNALSMLFYLPQWSEKLVRGLATCLCHPTMHVDTVCYALQIILDRQRYNGLGLSEEAFTSFMVTVGAVGVTSSELTALQAHRSTMVPHTILSVDDLLRYRVSSGTVPVGQYWSRRVAVVTCMLTCLARQPAHLSLAFSLYGSILRMSVLPIDAFYGVASALVAWREVASDKLTAEPEVSAALSSCVLGIVELGIDNSSYLMRCEELCVQLMLAFRFITEGTLQTLLARISAPCADLSTNTRTFVRLISGDETLRRFIRTDARCLDLCRRIHGIVKAALSQTDMATLEKDLLMERVESLSHFLAA
ncbi:hypothetical protein BC832DRAFT_264783 [Gaertneriomyces semiglobifer]|nr:hypothetical protein BC832DRAFT_264783 [Gaertneriomyces semiglobifer]